MLGLRGTRRSRVTRSPLSPAGCRGAGGHPGNPPSLPAVVPRTARSTGPESGCPSGLSRPVDADGPLLALVWGGPRFALQVLVCPTLDDRNDTPSAIEFDDIPS